MNNSFETMDMYFEGNLTPEEKEAFEITCVQDSAFAYELATYVAIKDYLKFQSLEQQRQHFYYLLSSEKHLPTSLEQLKDFNKENDLKINKDSTKRSKKNIKLDDDGE